MRTAQDLLDELNSVDESVSIEAKRASEVGQSVLETVSSFSNEPGLGGGHLVLGVSSRVNAAGDREYWAEGVPDPDKTLLDLGSQCNGSLNQALRPEMRSEMVDGKPVVVVLVAEADPRSKPVYLKKVGLPKGAFRRVGSADVRCNDDDVFVLRDVDRPAQAFDAATPDGADFADFSEEAIAGYRRMRKELNPTADELSLDNPGLLRALNAVSSGLGESRPTIAGLLLFGNTPALRRLLPSMRIDYIRIVGTTWDKDPDATLDIRRPLILAAQQAVNAVLDDLPRGFSLADGDLQSRQEPVLPRDVLREAIANAVMHRSYRINEPIQIIRYSDRIEIINPGYSLKNPSELGQPGSRRRNPHVAEVLHDVNLAETKGTGIARMQRLSREAGLTPPEFTSDRDNNRFRTVLYLHHMLTPDTHAWLAWVGDQTGQAVTENEAKALVSARAIGALTNADCRELTGLDTLGASQVLRGLRDRNLLEKHGGGSRTYYRLPERLDREPPSAKVGKAGSEVSKQTGEVSKSGSEVGKPEEEPSKLELPAKLAAEVAKAGFKSLKKQELRNIIIRICSHQPVTALQLESLLNKTRSYLLTNHLGPMIDEKVLVYTHPDKPRHPDQRYAVPAAEPSLFDAAEA